MVKVVLFLQNAINTFYNLYYHFWDLITKFWPGSTNWNTPFQVENLLLQFLSKSSKNIYFFYVYFDCRKACEAQDPNRVEAIKKQYVASEIDKMREKRVKVNYLDSYRTLQCKINTPFFIDLLFKPLFGLIITTFYFIILES